jgi:hypothetical protein
MDAVLQPVLQMRVPRLQPVSLRPEVFRRVRAAQLQRDVVIQFESVRERVGPIRRENRCPALRAARWGCA